MTLTLSLTPDEEDALRARAAQTGQPAEDYALALLRRDFSTANGQISSQAVVAKDDAILRASLAEFLAEAEATNPIRHTVPEKNTKYVDFLVEKFRKQGLDL